MTAIDCSEGEREAAPTGLRPPEIIAPDSLFNRRDHFVLTRVTKRELEDVSHAFAGSDCLF